MTHTPTKNSETKIDWRGQGTYGVVTCPDEQGMDALRSIFSDGQADEMNFVLFSTSGIHGHYLSIEEVERGPVEDYGNTITYLIVHPRRVCLRYGNCIPNSRDDFNFLKRLRASSLQVLNTRAPNKPASMREWTDVNYHAGVVLGSSDGKTKESAQVVADYLLANPPMTPERGEGQEIDWLVEAFGDTTHPEYQKMQMSDERFVEVCEWAVQTYLSRQSAVGGDWDGDAALLDLLLFVNCQRIPDITFKTVPPPSDRLDIYCDRWAERGEHGLSGVELLSTIRRALRCATRTPEGEEGHASKSVGAYSGFLRGYRSGMKTDFTPPPRPTRATGGDNGGGCGEGGNVTDRQV